MSASAQDLADIATDLQTSVEKFKIQDEKTYFLIAKNRLQL